MASIMNIAMRLGGADSNGAVYTQLCDTSGNVKTALQAGSALVGKVGIDQTTVGTTNAVSLAQIGATTVATGNGVVGAGVQRVAIASDNTTFPVTATLAAGSALAGKVGIDQTTSGTTNAVAIVNQYTWTRTFTTSADMSTAAAISPAPTAGQKLVIGRVLISNGASAGECFLQEETSATVFLSVFLAINTHAILEFPENNGKFKLDTADKKLFGKGPANTIRFTVWSRSEA